MNMDYPTHTRPLTQRFRDLYSLGGNWPKWVRFLWLGFLVWLEERYLDALVEQEVTDAVEGWHKEEQILHPDPQPIITESPSEVPGLPNLRITAPWVDREVEYDRE
jgi:hypothetical protein